MEQEEDWKEAFHKVFTKINERFNSSNQILNEGILPKFNNVEEALKYFNAVPYDEWLNNARKKYNI